MPVYRPQKTEYPITQGRVTIVMDDGTPLPAHWAQPVAGGRYPGLALLHDWWGITAAERRLAHLLAGLGFVVIMPDLFDGRTAVNARESLLLVEALGAGGFPRADATLTALEKHSRVNLNVAAVGLGLGGSLAYEVALKRPDLEAAVSFYGFPQRCFTRFSTAHAPILALYGEHEPFVSPAEVRRLREELAESPLPHQVVVLERTAREFLSEPLIADSHLPGAQALDYLLNFLDRHLRGTPRRPLAAKGG